MFFMGFVLFFFRVPKRVRVGADNVVTSVADGRVVVIDKVYDDEYVKGEIRKKVIKPNLENMKWDDDYDKKEE